MYNLEQLKTQLEQQLASVNQMINRPVLQPAPVPNIEAMINAAVSRQIAQIAPPVTVMSAIGSHMSLEDQKWVSANLSLLPQFLQTKEGKDIVMLTVEGFKTYCGYKEEESQPL